MKVPFGRDVPPAMVWEGLDCSFVIDRPYIVGILNLTPDSFSDGSHFMEFESALAHAQKMAFEGADLIDIGGESTRPGAALVSAQEELDRVIPIIESLHREIAVPLSIDTTKSVVAREAIAAGASFVNDISGLTFDDRMAQVVADSGAGLIVMHTRGKPDNMQKNTCYDDLISDVSDFLTKSLEMAETAGVDRNKIAVDPGVGFGKNVSGNLELLNRAHDLLKIGRPIMLGTSRKSFIGAILNKRNPADRLYGSLATIALGYANGVRLFRVHDVAASREVVDLAKAVCDGSWSRN